MLLSLRFVVALSLSATPLTLSAPLNGRNVRTLLRRQAPEGWLCHYDGPAESGVDPSLDLPTMLEGLCAKVKYAYVGCESFHSKAPKRVEPIVAVSAASVPQSLVDTSCPGSDGQSSLSACVNLLPGAPSSDEEPSSAPLQAQSAPDDDENGDHNKGPKFNKKPKHHKAHHATKADPDQNLGAQSFNESPSDTPDKHSNKPKSHHGHKPKTKKTHPKSQSSDEEPSSNVGAKSIDEDPAADNGCTDSQYFSAEAGQCVDKSFYSQPNDDSTCKKGDLDLILNLCLDISLLGLDNPTPSPSAANTIGAAGLQPDDSSPEAEDNTCASGQKYSNLVSACVADKLFAKPSTGNECESGWGLEPILGICLDLSNCPDKGDSLL